MASAKDALPVAVPLEDIIAVRYQMAKKASRLRVIAGGILGGIGGLLVGTPIAFAIGSDTSETAAVAVFLAMPVAGAWAGTKLAGRSMEWKTLIVQK